MTRYAIVLDTRRCIGCHSCTVACRTHKDLPLDTIYNPVFTSGPTGIFPNVHMINLPMMCMHCANPPCVECCPSGASYQRPDGIVMVDAAKCVGCKACIMACPYGARIPNHKTGTVEKCDFCSDRLAVGKEPFCVQTCHQRARIFGNLDDHQSEVYKLVNSKPVVSLLSELGTQPNAFYILD